MCAFVLTDDYHEDDPNLDPTSSLSATPTNSVENHIAYSNTSSRPTELDVTFDNDNESNTEREKENDETDVISDDISFKQRQEMAKTTRRKKKKTNSSLVATTFKELYQLTGKYKTDGIGNDRSKLSRTVLLSNSLIDIYL